MSYEIRTYGDPVLKTKAAPVTDVDGRIVRLVDDTVTRPRSFPLITTLPSTWMTPLKSGFRVRASGKRYPASSRPAGYPL